MEELQKIVAPRAPGPRPSFSVVHAILLLEAVAGGRVGRKRLTSLLGLGEGAVRTLLRRMVSAGWIEVSQKGCRLTREGRRVWRWLKRRLPRRITMRDSWLAVGSWAVAVLVRRGAHRVTNGVQQRDAAIMEGARGATTIVCTAPGQLQIPGLQKKFYMKAQSDLLKLYQLLNPRPGDAIIIGSGNTEQEALVGAIAASLTLIDC